MPDADELVPADAVVGAGLVTAGATVGLEGWVVTGDSVGAEFVGEAPVIGTGLTLFEEGADVIGAQAANRTAKMANIIPKKAGFDFIFYPLLLCNS
jgi:hypothetical protein